MFDQLAPKYDFINRILSFGIDLRWRKALRKFIPPGEGFHLLDLATGTGDQLFTLCEGKTPIARAVGLDRAEKMLDVARKKLDKFRTTAEIEFAVGDATDIPFPDNSFDIVSISFGIRNVPDYRKALREIYRVLKPGGRTLILESTVPKFIGWRELYLFYLRKVLPRVGGLLSGNKQAYIYLDQSVEEFPSGETFRREMEAAGFNKTRYYTFSAGIATLYIGEKLQ